MKEIDALRRLPDAGGAVPAVDVVDATLSAIRVQARGGGVDPVLAFCSAASCAVAAVAVPLGVSAWWAYTDPLASFLRPFMMVMQ
ncbi:MAG: hypothetical protein KAV82_06050 [Phycisphaerae bacterium]|nr:hypothetical protein [Phycisphaerae bacterium]